MHAKHYWWYTLTAIVLLQGSGFNSLPDHFLSFTLTLSTLCCYSLHIRIIIIIIVLKHNFSQCQQLKHCILTSFSITTKCYKYIFMYVSICEYHSWARSSLIFFYCCLSFLPCVSKCKCLSTLLLFLNFTLISHECFPPFFLHIVTAIISHLSLFPSLLTSLPGSVCFCWTYSADRLLPSVLFSSCSRG